MFGGFQPANCLKPELSRNQDQQSKDRISRTLTLRRPNRITLSAFTHKKSFIGDLNRSLLPCFEPQVALAAFNSKNEKKINEYCQQLMENCSGKGSLNSILNSEEIGTSLVSILNSPCEFSQSLIITVIKFVSVIFPLLDEQMMSFYVDEGLVTCLYTFLEIDNVNNITPIALQFASAIVSSSNYARNAFFSFGLHTNVIEIATDQSSLEITDTACQTLEALFSGLDPDDAYSFLNECVEPLGKLLSALKSKASIQLILNVFVEMSNTIPSIVFILFNMNLAPFLIQLLDDPDLVGVSLCLIGNMTVAQPFQVKIFLECGLFQKLLTLLSSNYTSECLWIFSNLLESVTDQMLELLDNDFIIQITSLSLNAAYAIEKEAAYFLSTFVIFGQNQISLFKEHTEVISILVEMLGCGSEKYILRCMDGIIRFANFISLFPNDTSQLRQEMIESNLRDRLSEFLDQQSTFIIKDRAVYLLNALDKFEKMEID